MGVTYLPFALADAGYAEWNKINIHNESDFGFFSIRPFTPYRKLVPGGEDFHHGFRTWMHFVKHFFWNFECLWYQKVRDERQQRWRRG